MYCLLLTREHVALLVRLHAGALLAKPLVVVGTKPPVTVRYKIVNVVVFAILNAFTLRKEEDEDFVVGGVLLLTVVLFKDDEKRGVDKDTTEFETIIYILLEERMHNELFESDEKREEVSKKPVFFYAKIKFF